MIYFKRIVYQNFLSIGDNPVEIDLDYGGTSLIVGANGEGKSVLLDALSFGLFGKPHRSINKPQLVNSINNKKCLVTIDFCIGSHEYQIIRGIKPSVFEIYKNGEMLNRDSNSRDYQKILESQILKLNHKSFHQIVVLGSSSFIPFMQLSAAHRREVIEDLLDIRIFTRMNTLLKDKKAQIRDNLKSIESELMSLEDKIEMKQKHNDHLRSMQEQGVEEINKEIEQCEQEIEELKSIIDSSKEEINTIDHQLDSTISSRKSKLYGYEGTISGKIKTLEKEQSFFQDNDECPTCFQSITDDLRKQAIERTDSSLNELRDGYQKLKKEIQKVEDETNEFNELMKRTNELSSKIDRSEYQIRTKKQYIIEQNKKLSNMLSDDHINESVQELNELEIKQKQTKNQRVKLDKSREICLIAEKLLKDDGIKTKIIEQYLPIMNQLINKYLSIFDFFVSFTLDESFDEQIRSRHRDDFSYSSFSEGEKAKIDLALMLTWRRIAEMKNSTHTNLLLMDEVFDGSLDEAGSDALMKLFKTFGSDISIFVISHKQDVWIDKFDRVLKFQKVNNFSQMKDIS